MCVQAQDPGPGPSPGVPYWQTPPPPCVPRAVKHTSSGTLQARSWQSEREGKEA